VAGVAASEGVALQHVKPHGALFNMAMRDADLASAIARATARFNSELMLFGLPDSELLKAGRAEHLRVVAEAFADRAYEADGSLVSRSKPGSVILDASAVVARAVQMAKDGTVAAVDGTILKFRPDTICIHSDTPSADDLAARVRAALDDAGVTVGAIGAV
jgi:UPF0271 protein